MKNSIGIICFVFFFLMSSSVWGQHDGLIALSRTSAEIALVSPLEAEIDLPKHQGGGHVHFAPVFLISSDNLTEGFPALGVGVHLEGHSFEAHCAGLYNAEEELGGVGLGVAVDFDKVAGQLHVEVFGEDHAHGGFSLGYSLAEFASIGGRVAGAMEHEFLWGGGGPELRLKYGDHSLGLNALWSRGQVGHEDDVDTLVRFNFLRFGADFELHFHL